MKVIRAYGEDKKPVPVTKTVQITCTGCESLLEIIPDDIKEPTETFAEENHKADGCVECGVCHVIFPVNSKELKWIKS